MTHCVCMYHVCKFRCGTKCMAQMEAYMYGMSRVRTSCKYKLPILYDVLCIDGLSDTRAHRRAHTHSRNTYEQTNTCSLVVRIVIKNRFLACKGGQQICRCPQILREFYSVVLHVRGSKSVKGVMSKICVMSKIRSEQIHK